MYHQLTLMDMGPTTSDVVYTPEWVAVGIIDWLKPSGLCLDPWLGDGVFYRNLPDGADWCELEKNRDFFDYNTEVEWIIGNPPYSIFQEWLSHSFDIAHEVAYILPTNKVFQRQVIMRMINEWGGIKGMVVYGSGSTVGFPFGFSVGTFHFSKGYKGPCNMKLGGIT